MDPIHFNVDSTAFRSLSLIRFWCYWTIAFKLRGGTDQGPHRRLSELQLESLMDEMGALMDGFHSMNESMPVNIADAHGL